MYHVSSMHKTADTLGDHLPSDVEDMVAILHFISVLSVLALYSLEVVSDRCVTSHFIHGNTQNYSVDDWNQAFELASKAEIDAFVFNIAQEGWTEKQLDAAFDVSQRFFTKICFSFDFAVAPWNTASVIETLKRYVNHPGHYRFAGKKGGGKALVSTFNGAAGANVNWADVKSAVPDIYVIPNLLPNDLIPNIPAGIDGVLNWNAWPTRDNKPIDAESSIVDDLTMVKAIGKDKAYATLVSPWSFTDYHVPNLVKQWVFKSDELLVTRWNQMLNFSTISEDTHIDMVELYSWNDYGESNHQNNISQTHDDEFSGGAENWCKGLKHDGWRELSVPFTRAFKAGSTSVTADHITEEIVVFQHRPYPKKTGCTIRNQVIDGEDLVPDQVTIISVLKSPVDLVIKSGGVTTQAQAAAGVNTNRVPMQVGAQSVVVMRNGVKCGEVVSAVEVTNTCNYTNYNANVETVFVKC